MALDILPSPSAGAPSPSGVNERSTFIKPSHKIIEHKISFPLVENLMLHALVNFQGLVCHPALRVDEPRALSRNQPILSSVDHQQRQHRKRFGPWQHPGRSGLDLRAGAGQEPSGVCERVGSKLSDDLKVSADQVDAQLADCPVRSYRADDRRHGPVWPATLICIQRDSRERDAREPLSLLSGRVVKRNQGTEASAHDEYGCIRLISDGHFTQTLNVVDRPAEPADVSSDPRRFSVALKVCRIHRV